MTERYKELAEQATETVKCGLNGTSTTESFNRKKFAELVVRECIDTAFHRGHPDLEFLLKHFGVEE